MFSDTSAPVLRMIRRAATIYKHLYGSYPETIGLCVFTWFKEWQETNFLDTYFFREVQDDVPIVFDKDMMLTITNVSIKIEPATFSPVKYNRYQMNPHPSDLEQGKNGVWCKRGEHEVAIDLLITEGGYHAAIAEEREWEAWQEHKEEEVAGFSPPV